MKKKVQVNPELLKEELKKFKLLSEYDFYQEKKELPEYKELILGDNELDEADDKQPEDLAPDDAKSETDSIAGDLGLGDSGEGDSGNDSTESNGDAGDLDFGGEDENNVDGQTEMPADDSVEVDVTSLVKGSEEAKASADRATQNTQELLQKLADLEARIANMDKVTAKIDGLEREIIKRNPTPVEKLEMRSLSSYPYSQKLTDYWSDKEGAYDVMGNGNKKKEYILTKDDVDADFSPTNIKQSFNVTPDMENEYEEEDF